MQKLIYIRYFLVIFFENVLVVNITYPLLKTVGEAGVVAPRDTLIVRQATGALRLEIKKGLRKGIFIVEMRGSNCVENRK